MMTLHMPNQIGIVLLLRLASLMLAPIVVCGIALGAQRLLRRACLPLQHAILVTGMIVVLVSPLLVGLIQLTGCSLILVAVSDSTPPSPGTHNLASISPTVPGNSDLQMTESQLSSNQTGDSLIIERGERRDTDHSLKPPMKAPRAGFSVQGGDAVGPVSEMDALSWLAFGLLGIWFLGSCQQLFSLYKGFREVRRFLASVLPVDDPTILNTARAAAAALNLKARPSIGHSPFIEAPVSTGVLRAQIVMPSSQLCRWSDQQWMLLMVHEMAHVRRHDLSIGILQRIAIAMYWWNPLIRPVSTASSLLREQICDDLVTKHAAGADNYATLIVELAGRIMDRCVAGPVVTVVGDSPGELCARVHRLMDPQRNQATSLNRRMKCVALTFGLAMVVSLISTSVHFASARGSDNEFVGVPNVSGSGETDRKDQQVESPSAKPNALETQLKKTVRVVDAAGKPIPGASVVPFGVVVGRTSGLWTPEGYFHSEPPTLITDAEGRATILFPRFADPADKIRPTLLICRVEHPDYVESLNNQIWVAGAEGEKTATIVLQHGAQLEVSAVVGERPLPMDRVFALWSAPSFDGQKKTRITAEGRLQLPRLPAGGELMRLVYTPPDGSVLFSDPQRLRLVDGERRQLRFEMKRAVSVEGRLDNHVPRPVKNGRVVADAILAPEDGHNLGWRVWAAIREDGSFALGPLPRGDLLQVVALCDGYMAESGSPPDFVSASEREAERRTALYGRPQVFSLTNDSNEITLKMTPTGDCVIHVVGADQRPVAGAKCSFWPNVHWWSGGSEFYCHPLSSTLDALTDPVRTKKNLHEGGFDMFTAATDAAGRAVVKNLPPEETIFAVHHAKLELPLDDSGGRFGRVALTAGRETEVTVALQPTGTEVQGEAMALRLEGNCGDDTGLIAKPAPPKMFTTQCKDTELAGVVTDESSSPLAGVRVDAWTWHPGNETTTDKEGRFLLSGFERGEAVEVEFTKKDYSPSLFVAKRAGSRNWTVVLTQGTRIEGKVLDTQGRPVPGAFVRAWRGPFHNPQVMIGEVWTETHADEAGRYRLDLEPYQYNIQVRVPGVGAVQNEKIELKPKEKKQLDLQLTRGVTFRAVVRNSVTHQPVEGIVLWNWQQPGVEGTSDKNGMLEVPTMMNGNFAFNVSAADVNRKTSDVAGDYARWWSESAALAHQRAGEKDRHGFQRNFDGLTFDMRGDEVKVEIFVEPAVSITGRVLDPDGKAVSGATVAPAKTGSGNSLTGDTRFSRRTDKEGRFTMKLPASGDSQFNLVAHDGDYEKWRKWANGSGEPLRTVPGQRIENVELKLIRPGTIRGRVTDKAGQPRAHVQVRAAAVDKHDNRYYHPTTTTDDAGRYELRFVAPGEQHIQIEPFWLSADEAPADTTRVVTVKSDAAVDNVDFAAD